MNDDTVETSSVDDLLQDEVAEPPASLPDDEEDYLPVEHRRSKLTTGLVVGLIFMIGVFCGVVIGKVLSPSPAPQVVYVLNDAGATPSPSTGPR